MPFSSDISTRLTWATGNSRPSGCQMKASAALRSVSVARWGANRSRALAIRSSTSSGLTEAVVARRLVAGRRDDLDFDLGMRLFPEVGLLLAGWRRPRKRPRGKRAANGWF